MPNDVKIAHVFPSQSWGGAEIQMVELADWQRQQAVNAVIWCAPDSPIHKEAVRRGVPVILDPVPLKSVWPRPWRFARVLKRERVTHLHIHWGAGLRIFFGIKWFVNVRVFSYNHMWVTLDKKDFFHRLAFRQIDKMTVSGPRGWQSVMQHYAIQESQLEFCPYGIDFRSVPLNLRGGDRYDKTGLRASLGLPEDGLLFGYFGRIDRQKGVKEFVQAVTPLLAEIPQLNVLMVGDPTLNEEDAAVYNAEVTKLIEASPHKNRIHRFGHQREFHKFMACCDLIVVPSYMECYSILIVHSLALGIPVLSTNAGGTPDLVAPPERGWLVESKNIEQLREQMRDLAQNPRQIYAKSKTCRDYALNFHSHEKVIERLNEIYGI